jgi:hypothetical protein
MANFKSAILKSKQIIITNDSNTKQHGLKERAFHFAERVHEYIKRLPRFITNNETGRQLARSSGSIGANYIEANEILVEVK